MIDYVHYGDIRIISFKYRCTLQARFLRLKSYITGEDAVDLAQYYSARLADKIQSKFRMYNPVTKRRIF